MVDWLLWILDLLAAWLIVGAVTGMVVVRVWFPAPDEMKFNVCFPYYHNPGMLKLHLQTWASYPLEST